MTTRRNLLFALGLGALSVALPASAQRSTEVRRIGFLGSRARATPSKPNTAYDAFVRGMRELGYVEGKNLIIEWRYAAGNYALLPSLAAELVQLNVEVIVTHSTPGALAAKQATSKIPIVFASSGDPVANGLVASLARPGGNLTGLSNLSSEASTKHLEFLKELLPKLTHVGVFVNPSVPFQTSMRTYQATANKLGVTLSEIHAATADEITRGFAAIVASRAKAVAFTNDSFFSEREVQIAELALRHRLPSAFVHRGSVLAGGLFCYGPNADDNYHGAATYVDKILDGAKPGELPVQQPTKLRLAFNLKTAKALGLTISPALLLRADEIME